ncbi:MAG: GNAT family N-acetyltransferase [Acidimicrobiaceae bacterium]|nr:GNAT family N-acetyltransferase [Acidimicrobiaceae bacterium]
MELFGPILLAQEHKVDHFRCGSEPLDDWIKTRSRANQASGASRTWVVLDGQVVVAYYASASAAIICEAAPKTMRRNQPEVLPAVLLSRLAVHSGYQGRGLAASLLKHFMLKALQVSERVGARVVLVHTKEDGAKGFYEKYGFIQSPLDPLTLVLLLPQSPAGQRVMPGTFFIVSG